MATLFFVTSLMSEFERLMPSMVGRLSLAAALGAAVGLERTLNDRPAGLRTGMFICFGSALFTILSIEIGSPNNADRIAANIITGIGFIGAGSIIHSKNSVVGLTSAATIFVIAAIGMAAGAGLYASAVFATVLILFSLRMLGTIETRYNIKSYPLRYEAVGQDATQIKAAIVEVLDSFHHILRNYETVQLRERTKIVFEFTARRRLHQQLLHKLGQQPEIKSAESCSVPIEE